MPRPAHRKRSSPLSWLRSAEGLRMTVFLLLLHGFLGELSTALAAPTVGAVALVASYLLLLAVALLPPTDDQGAG